MRAITCPKRETLQHFLLGKSPPSESEELEKHLTECLSCAAIAETLPIGDDLTEALALGARQQSPQTPDDENALLTAIQRAKSLASQLDTQLGSPASTAIVTDSPSKFAVAETEIPIPKIPEHDLGFLAPPEHPDELGRLGDYRILTILGVGGMGMVFKAEDIRLGRLVALKVMLPKVAMKPQAKERFLREARATAALSHDHVVQIHQVGEDRDVPFIAMQYLEGQSLQITLTRSEPLAAQDIARIGKEVALGLAAAHERGLIHRDIKPDNVWIESKTRRAKILDFGLARDLASDAGLTQSGTILGTPRYMAPEQVTGENVDHRTDLFSLGSMLYHLATKKPAFTEENIPALLYAIAQSAPQPLGDVVPKIDPALADLIMRLLSKEPKSRPQRAAEVAKQFARIETVLQVPVNNETAPIECASDTKPSRSQQGQPPRRSWPLAVIAGTAFALILGVIVITIRNRDGEETTIRVAEGTTTLNLAPGSNVTIHEEPTGSGANEPLPSVPTQVESISRIDDESHHEELTEEDLFPPLEKWLEGRKRLTVAQDGSAMFTTIQAAIDVQRDGEVIVILDKGPYRESLDWRNKTGCGIISRCNSQIITDQWDSGDPEFFAFNAHQFVSTSDCRIHGLSFLFSPNKTLDSDNANWCYGIRGTSNDALCFENCSVVGAELWPSNCRLVASFYQPSNSSTAGFGYCVRNNAFLLNRLYCRGESGKAFVTRNWIRVRDPKLPGSYPSLVLIDKTSGDGVDVSHNVLEQDQGFSQIWFGSLEKQTAAVTLRLHNNTFVGGADRISYHADGAGELFEALNNLCWVANPSADPRSMHVAAKKHWKVRNNVSLRKLSVTLHVGLDNHVVPAMEFKSTHPLDRNCFRVDGALIPNDGPFPGALPPGPAPPEGDWFTALQDRLKDVLPSMTPEAREFWSRPLKLADGDTDTNTTTATDAGPMVEIETVPTISTIDKTSN